jgi:hypothetical protein
MRASDLEEVITPSGVIPPTGWGCPEPGGSGNRVATRHTPGAGII